MPPTAAVSPEEFVDRARAIAPLARSLSDESERTGTTPRQLVDAFADAGFFRLWLPRSIDGHDAAPMTFYGVIEEIAAADGSAGWNLMNGGCCGLMSVYLRPRVAQDIYGDPRAVVAGQIAPNGKAEPAEGGFTVNGRWSFGSGIGHARWVASGVVVTADGGVAPRHMHVMTPVDDVRVDRDSWRVSGLRGTGSFDYAMDGAFVPQDRLFEFFVSQRYHQTPLSLLPRSIFAMSIGAVTVGIARGMLEAFLEFAPARRVPPGTLLSERPEAQAAAARAAALIGAARAHMQAASGDIWQSCLRGEAPSLASRLLLRVAAVSVPEMCAQAVDLLWKAAGAASVRESNRFERCFRDVHAATQHLGVSEPLMYDAGRGLLGLEPQITPL